MASATGIDLKYSAAVSGKTELINSLAAFSIPTADGR
jgi:hypothetical protein